MQNYKYTLGNLAEREQYLMRELMLVQTAIASLKSGTINLFQVHIQGDMPNIRSVMTEGHDVVETSDETKRLYEEHNGRATSRCEAFACLGKFRVPIDPRDLPPGFILDSRLTEKLCKMVFAPGEKLPGWHLEKPTPTEVPVTT